MYLLEYKTLKNEVLSEANRARLTLHPRSTKLYKNLKEFYWWSKMKRQLFQYTTDYTVSTSGKRTSKSKKTFIVINTSVEVRGYYHRVCVGITKRKERE